MVEEEAMAGATRKTKGRFTYDDYLTWVDEPRQEIINGVSYAMASPTVRHQTLIVNLTLVMGPFFKSSGNFLAASPMISRLRTKARFRVGSATKDSKSLPGNWDVT